MVSDTDQIMWSVLLDCFTAPSRASAMAALSTPDAPDARRNSPTGAE
jgi:hypothetical protein